LHRFCHRERARQRRELELTARCNTSPIFG
jgi:hypothetical protein